MGDYFMDTPNIFHFLVFTLLLAILENIFVRIVPIDEATLVYIGPIKTTVNTILFLVGFAFLMRFLLRQEPRGEYTKPSEFIIKEPILK